MDKMLRNYLKISIGFLLLMALLLVMLPGTLASPQAQTGGGPFQLTIPFVPNGYEGGVGTVRGKVVDARDNSPLDGVEVCYFDETICTFTNTNGDYNFGPVASGLRYFSVNASDFAEFNRPYEVIANIVNILNFALSPDDLDGEGQYRIVVTWDQDPPDIDAHLYTPDLIQGKSHIFQGHFVGCNEFGVTACMDRDEIEGFGPETITILEAQQGTYKYAIQKFEPACEVPPGSGSFEECPTQLEDSGAIVQVYDFTGLRGTFEVPSINPNSYKFWYVFKIEFGLGSEISLDTINCFADQPPTEDTPPQCPVPLSQKKTVR